VKDAFHEHVIYGNKAAVNPEHLGTKAAAYYLLQLGSDQSATLKLRLTDTEPLEGMDVGSGIVGGVVSPESVSGRWASPVRTILPKGSMVRSPHAKKKPMNSTLPHSQGSSDDAKAVMRQAFGGMLWCKQFYHYDVHTWLEGDPAGPLRRRSAGTAATRIGRTFTTKTSFPCRTIGNTRVRRLGPGVSLHPAGAGGSRFRQGTAHPAAS